MTKLPYIHNVSADDAITSLKDKQYGEYYFIRKSGEQVYYAYRMVEMNRAGKSFMVVTYLPKRLMNEWISSGKVDKALNEQK